MNLKLKDYSIQNKDSRFESYLMVSLIKYDLNIKARLNMT
jgi:hypothetical protein